MSEVVLHDTDVVGAHDVRPARGRLQVITADTAWEAPGRADLILPGSRDASERDLLLQKLDLVAAEARARRAISSRPAGLDLFDVAAYAWLYAIGPVVQPATILRALIGPQRPGRLLWRSGDERRDASFRAALVAVGADTGVEVRYEGVVRPAPMRGRAVVGRGRRRVRRAAELGQHAREAQRRRGRARTGGVLLLDAFGHTAPVLTRLGRELQEAGFHQRFVGSTPAVAAASGAVGARGVLELLDPGAMLAAARAADRAAVLALEAARIALDPVTSPWGPLAPLLGTQFTTTTERVLADAAAAAVLGAALVDHLRPAALISTNLVSPFVRAASLAARRLGIPSVWVQHGLLRMDRYKTRITQDHFLCWGERDRRLLVDLGVDAARITVTGPVRPERAEPPPDASEPEQSDIVYLPSRTGGNLVSTAQSAQLAAAVVRAALAHRVRLLIKPHPGDRSPLYDELASRHDHVAVWRGPLERALHGQPVVVVSTSTAGLEACAAGCEVVVLGFAGVEVPTAYEDGAAVLIARSEEELHHCVEEAARGGHGSGGRRTAAAHLVADSFLDPDDGSPSRAAAAVTHVAQPLLEVVS